MALQKTLSLIAHRPEYFLRSLCSTRALIYHKQHQSSGIPPLSHWSKPSRSPSLNLSLQSLNAAGSISSRLFHCSSSNVQSSADSEDPRGKLIYTGANSAAVKVVKIFSLSTSAIGIAVQPWLLAELQSSSIAFKTAMVVTTSFFVIGTPLILHMLCKRYVLRLYFNEQTKIFTAVRVNLLAREKSFTFTPDEVELNTPSPFSNFKAGKHSFLLDSDQLRETHPEVYIAFMRYDKPIDITEFLDPKYRKPPAQPDESHKSQDSKLNNQSIKNDDKTN